MNADAPILLIVDPDAHLREAYAWFLFENGYLVTHCDSGEDALMAIEAVRPAVVVAAAVLPDTTGAELTRRIRPLDGTVDIGVIVLSARPSELEGEAVRAAGGNRYLLKPCEAPVLASEICGLLESRELHR